MSADLTIPTGPTEADAPRRHAFTFDHVQPERLRWLSRGRLAAGKLTVLEGDPGLGKSTLICDWAARISRGEALPGGEPAPPRGVLLLSAEDGLADTIRPRLDAAGADCTRVATLLAVPDATPYGRPPVIPGDVGIVEVLLRQLDAALLVIDPLVAYLDGQLNAYRDQDARRALAALAGMAERTGAAVLLVRHLTKAAGGPALYRGGGSIGIIGAARCGLLLASDPDDPTLRILAPTKGNLAVPPPSLAFRLTEVEGSGGVARLTWLGESPRRADDLLNPPDPEKRTERDEAKEWLQDALADGPLAARKLEERAKRNGFSASTLRRARKDLGVVVKRVGASHRSATYFWSLPASPTAARMHHVDHSRPHEQPEQHEQHEQQDARHPRPEHDNSHHLADLVVYSPLDPESTATIHSDLLLVDHVAHVDQVDHMEGGEQHDRAQPLRLPDPPAPWEQTAPVVCLDCGVELPPGRTYLCERCAA